MKWFISTQGPHQNPSLKVGKAETQDRNLYSGTEAETMHDCCLIAYSS